MGSSQHRLITPIVAALCFSSGFALGEIDTTSYGDARLKIRTEYDRTPNTPDHIIFGSLVAILSIAAEDDPVGTIERIQFRMKFDKIDAGNFLSKVQAAHSEIQGEHSELFVRILCWPSDTRSKNQLYAAMDALDDVRLLATEKHYMVFRQSLDPTAADRLSTWINERKLAHYHRTAEHKSVYEGTGQDVVTQVRQMCVSVQASSADAAKQ